MDEEKKNPTPNEEEKTPSEIMKEMQAAHAAEMEALKKQLAEEKAAHAKDVKELLLNGKKSNGNATDPAQIIAEKMRKKYYR